MIVKPMFDEPPLVRLSKSEKAILKKARIILGQVAHLRPDLNLGSMPTHITRAVVALEPLPKGVDEVDESPSAPVK